MTGGVPNLTLPTLARAGSVEFRACVADQVFYKTEPVMKALPGA